MRTWDETKKKFGFTSYADLMAKQFSYLDQIDFQTYLSTYEDLNELWHAVERDYDDTPLADDEFLCGCIFNYLTHDELKSYLEKRYNISYIEEATTRYFLANSFASRPTTEDDSNGNG